MSNISAIATQVGQYLVNQDQVAAFLAAHHDTHRISRKYKLLAREKSIGYKHAVIPDFNIEAAEKTLYNPQEPLPGTAERMLVFEKLAPILAEEAARKTLAKSGETAENITHIITISCTGVVAPGLEILLTERLGLHKNISRHSINFMGCYAAFHGLRLADLICKTTPNAKVLVVSVELCSLHFSRDTSDDNLLSTYLFSDGAAACLVSSQIPKNATYFNCRKFESLLLIEGKNHMAWRVGNAGFEMILSNQIPTHLRQNIAKIVDDVLQKEGVNRSDIAHYAIHPGGKNILKAFAEALQIDDEKLAHSYQILHDNGNMSSATILFVLEKLMATSKQDGLVYAAAFGPGLTVESGLFTLVHQSEKEKFFEPEKTENFV